MCASYIEAMPETWGELLYYEVILSLPLIDRLASIFHFGDGFIYIYSYFTFTLVAIEAPILTSPDFWDICTCFLLSFALLFIFGFTFLISLLLAILDYGLAYLLWDMVCYIMI